MVDYGVGNVGSLRPLFADLRLPVRRGSTPEDVRDAALVVLPGVGSARQAMRILDEGPLREALATRHASGGPIVGICLGAQLLHDHLEESGAPGLGLLPGKVASVAGGRSVNVGWRALDHEALEAFGLSDGVDPGDTMFFNHGYRLPAEPGVDRVLTSDQAVPAIVRREASLGLQFHPEKSQHAGRRLMRNVVRLLDVR